MALSTTTTAPTGWAANAAHNNFLRAGQIANQPYTPYGGNMLAGWNQGQQTGYNAIMNGAGVGLPAMQNAQGAALYAAQWGPERVAAQGYDPVMRGVMNTHAANAGPAQQAVSQNFLDANVERYMNPYTEAVINTTLGQLGRQRDVLQNQSNARASAAGAFGGSRQAIMASELNRNYLDTAAQTAANLQNQNFGQAQAAIAADQNRQAQTSQFNAGAGNQMAQFNAGLNQTALSQTAAAHNQALADQANARNQAGQFNAENGLRAQLANQQAGQNAVNTNLAAANALNGMGLDEQTRAFNAARAQYEMGQARTAFDQSGLDQQYNQWAAAQNYPLTQLGILQQGLNGYSSGTTTTAPGQSSNTAANVLAGGLGIGQILANGSNIASGASSLWNGARSLLSGW